MSAITDHLQTVRTRVCRAAQQAHRDPSSVNLLAVSKTQPVSAILEAAEAGQLAFGENYEQEAVRKIMEIRQNRPDLKLEWHFIGPIQSNKTRAIAEHFDWVHSVDRKRIARRLSDQRPEELADLVKAVSGMPRLKLRGLMAIPEPQSDPEKQRQPFSAMKTLFEELKHTGYDLDTLSMGMSDDMEAAVQEGATTVRIGTAIFGQRHYPGKR